MFGTFLNINCSFLIAERHYPLYTYLYLCGVRQKSLHKPLIAESGNSERTSEEELESIIELTLKNMCRRMNEIKSPTFAFYTFFQLSEYFLTLFHTGCSHFYSKFLQCVWNLKQELLLIKNWSNDLKKTTTNCNNDTYNIISLWLYRAGNGGLS